MDARARTVVILGRNWPVSVWVAFAMCVGVMGTALVSPLYPLYQAQWGLLPSDITGIYVAYMLGALLSLLFLGRLSDAYGFLPVLRAGSGVMLVGVLLSVVAWNTPVFVVSRIMIGIASGLITTSASAGLTQLNSGGSVLRTSAMTSLTIALGFGLGPLVGGLIAQWLPLPLYSAYAPSLLLGGLATYALFQLPAAATTTQRPAPNLRQWLPHITVPLPSLRRPFFIACVGACITFAVFGLYASLAPSFMALIVPWHGPAVSGLSIAMILFLSAGFQWLARPLHAKTCALWGLSLLAACNLLLVATTYTQSSILFVLSVLTTAAGHGLMNLSGIAIVSKVAGPNNRAGLLSTYLVVGYVGTIVPILAVGWVSNHLGLTLAVVIFCITMTALSLFLLVLAHRTPVIAAV